MHHVELCVTQHTQVGATTLLTEPLCCGLLWGWGGGGGEEVNEVKVAGQALHAHCGCSLTVTHACVQWCMVRVWQHVMSCACCVMFFGGFNILNDAIICLE